MGDGGDIDLFYSIWKVAFIFCPLAERTAPLRWVVICRYDAMLVVACV